MIRLAALFLLPFLLAGSAFGHEVRPAYLEIREGQADRYDILWKTPARGQATIRLDVRLPSSCSDVTPKSALNDGAARAVRWRVRCEGGLAGRDLTVEGLDRTMVEAIVRFVARDGASQSARLMKGETSFTVDEASTFLGVAAVYLPLGIDHILLGFDHLCFVFALLLLIRDTRRLIWSITAFTVAHSITLAVATLGYVSAPPGPIEALIAFSIAVVAAEAVAVNRQRKAARPGRPWIIAFCFGLLHGFGFAGALSETGLPGDAVPLALLFFNIGVEIGQLVFVAAVLIAAASLRKLQPKAVLPASMAAAYVIGTLSAYWTIERAVSIG